MSPLSIMVAPNGARKTHADHPNLPLNTDAIGREARACRDAGAQAIHLHVRDDKAAHSLDAIRYRDAIAAVRRSAGDDIVVQITTEAVGLYSPREQIETVMAVQPEAVSIATKELIPAPDAEAAAAALYAWAYERRIAMQHIVYSPEEYARLLDLITRGVVPGSRHSLIFPLGRYATDQQSDPAELIPFLGMVQANGGAERFDWWVCAFGTSETQALVAAAALGGHCRIGFENNFLNADGQRASSNAERVSALVSTLSGLNLPPTGRDETLRALGRPD